MLFPMVTPMTSYTDTPPVTSSPSAWKSFFSPISSADVSEFAKWSLSPVVDPIKDGLSDISSRIRDFSWDDYFRSLNYQNGDTIEELLFDKAKGLLGLDDSGSPGSPGSLGSPGSPGSPGFYPSPSAHQLDYLYADLAKHYGMNKETAYNEAMANTAYQRAVADMQMAGLNPASLFSAGRASSAGSGYASGSSSGGYSSAKGASKSDQLPGWIYFGVPALTQAVVTGATKNIGYGVVASQVAQNFLKAFNGTK